MRTGVAVVVTLVLLAGGCSGIGADDPGDDRTVNPMLDETPSVTATPTPELPPGITNSEIDSWRLAQAHQRTLAATSRTVIWRETVATQSGSVRANQTLVVRANGSLRYVRWTGHGTATLGSVRARSYWTNGTRTVERIVQTNGAERYDAYPGPPTGGLQAETTGWSRVYAALTKTNVSVVRTTGSGGDRRYVLRGRADRGAEGRLRNLSLRLTVTPEGVVESFHLRYETVRRGEWVQVTVRFRVTAIGKTGAARPRWFSRAMNESRKRGSRDRFSATNP